MQTTVRDLSCTISVVSHITFQQARQAQSPSLDHKRIIETPLWKCFSLLVAVSLEFTRPSINAVIKINYDRIYTSGQIQNTSFIT